MSTDTPQPNTYTRRAFIQTLLVAPLALGATALMPEEAEAATMKSGEIKLTVPAAWKSKCTLKKTATSVVGNNVCKYYTLTFKNTKGTILEKRVFASLILSYPKGSKPATGKPRITKGNSADNVVEWRLIKGNTTLTVAFFWNVPFLLWESYHQDELLKGGGYCEDLPHRFKKISDKQAKALLKVTTGGRIKLSQIKKWGKSSQNTVANKSRKFTRAWVGAKVVKKIQFV